MTYYLGSCGDCGRQWNALSHAHCPACCAHFSSDTAFDLHLGPIPASGPPVCRDPAKLRRRDGSPKLVDRDGIWGWPDRNPEYLATRRHTAVEARRSPATVPDTPDCLAPPTTPGTAT